MKGPDFSRPPIVVRGLTKSFKGPDGRPFKALDSLDFTMEAGTLTPAGTCRVRWERKGEQILVTVSLERKERILLCLGETEEVLELEGTVERRIWERKR